MPLRNLATEGLQIRAVTMTNRRRHAPGEGKSSYVLSRFLSSPGFSHTIPARVSRALWMPPDLSPLPSHRRSCIYAKGQARTTGANRQLSFAPTMVSNPRATLVWRDSPSRAFRHPVNRPSTRNGSSSAELGSCCWCLWYTWHH